MPRIIEFAEDAPGPEPFDLFIVKVQLPIFSSSGWFAGDMLIYNEESTVYMQTPTTPEMVERMEGDLKRYMWAYVDEEKILQLFHDAPEQDW